MLHLCCFRWVAQKPTPHRFFKPLTKLTYPLSSWPNSRKLADGAIITMSLEDVFPEDPYQPSLQYAASSLIPFNLPWSTNKIKVGTGFHSRLASSDNPFASESAFDEYSLKSARLRYRSETGGTYAHTESSTAAHSRDHMDFSLAASADVAIVNVSGQAKFEQNAIKNTDVSTR